MALFISINKLKLYENRAEIDKTIIVTPKDVEMLFEASIFYFIFYL